MKCKVFSGRNVQKHINAFLKTLGSWHIKKVIQSVAVHTTAYKSIETLTISVFYTEPLLRILQAKLGEIIAWKTEEVTK